MSTRDTIEGLTPGKPYVDGYQDCYEVGFRDAISGVLAVLADGPWLMWCDTHDSIAIRQIGGDWADGCDNWLTEDGYTKCDVQPYALVRIGGDE